MMRPIGRTLLFIVALLLTVTACSGEGADPATTTTADPGTTTTTTAGTTTTTTGGSGEGTATTAATTSTTAATTTTTGAEPGVVTLAVDVTDGVVTGGGRRSVPEGSVVRLVVTADVEDLAHVHGYDLEAAVSPNSAAVFDFAAETTGIFTVELENSGLELLQLEIVP
jgi:pectate lyase